MSNKVQAKSDGCETSLFHHGFLKLLVLNELQKISRDWSSFLFMNGFELETLTPTRNPKAKGTPSPLVAESSQPVVTKSKRFVKLKPRKQVDKRTEKTQVLVAATPSPAKQRSKSVKEAKQKQVSSQQEIKRVTRSQAVASKGKTVVSSTEDSPMIKGNLDDILHAIDIEESPIV